METDINTWIAEFGRRNEVELCVPIVASCQSFSTNFEQTTLICQSFSTAPHLQRYPILTFSHGLYVFNFISKDNKHFDHDTRLDIYDVGVLGEEEPGLIHPQRSLPARRGSVDLYFETWQDGSDLPAK